MPSCICLDLIFYPAVNLIPELHHLHFRAVGPSAGIIGFSFGRSTGAQRHRGALSSRSALVFHVLLEFHPSA